MLTLKRICIGIVALALSPIVIVCGMILLTVVQRAVGYYPGAAGWQIGELATKEKNVKLCNNILEVPWNSFLGLSPTAAAMRMDCINEYASIAKDPSACELIPSRYRLSCVGAAENAPMPCNTEVEPYSVFWREGEIEHIEHLRECSQADASRSVLGNQCCEVAKVAFIKEQNDCSFLKSDSLIRDRCLYALAWKQKDEHYCDEIVNINAHAACIVQSKAIRQDPSICPDCAQPVESVDDLQDVQ